MSQNTNGYVVLRVTERNERTGECGVIKRAVYAGGPGSTDDNDGLPPSELIISTHKISRCPHYQPCRGASMCLLLVLWGRSCVNFADVSVEGLNSDLLDVMKQVTCSTIFTVSSLRFQASV